MKNVNRLSLPLIALAATSLTLAACDRTGKNEKDMEQKHAHGQADQVYACPMHPEVTGKKGDKCPECGMALEAVPGDSTAKTEVTLSTSPQVIKAGTPATLTLAFRRNDQNVPLEISHERNVHLMIVNDALTWFRHIHPEEHADGSYTISETFPEGGKYILFSDFKAQGAAPAVDKKEIAVSGSAGKVAADLPDKFVSAVDGYTLTLENAKDLKTGKTQPLEISVTRNGKKLAESDIEPYLGATAHIAMISRKDKDFLHIHPVSGKRFPIYAEAHIRKPGVYRIWVEFQTNGKVHTADFTVTIGEGEKTGENEQGHGHH